MQEFIWNINSKRTSSVLRDLKALLHLWKKEVKIKFSKEACERLKKSAISSGEYQNHGHMCFVKGTEKIDVVYAVDTLCVISFEISNGSSLKTYKPVKFPARELKIQITERKRKRV